MCASLRPPILATSLGLSVNTMPRSIPQSIACTESPKGQICRTKAEPQQIVATRLLYCLQHPVLFKSSAKDSPPQIFHFNSWTSDTNLSVHATEPTKYGTQQKAYFNATNICGTNIIVSGTDSDLEAFSHNPADDSFASLPDRTDANTNYLNEQFLSYYPQLPLR